MFVWTLGDAFALTVLFVFVLLLVLGGIEELWIKFNNWREGDRRHWRDDE